MLMSNEPAMGRDCVTKRYQTMCSDNGHGTDKELWLASMGVDMAQEIYVCVWDSSLSYYAHRLGSICRLFSQSYRE